MYCTRLNPIRHSKWIKLFFFGAERFATFLLCVILLGYEVTFGITQRTVNKTQWKKRTASFLEAVLEPRLITIIHEAIWVSHLFIELTEHWEHNTHRCHTSHLGKRKRHLIRKKKSIFKNIHQLAEKGNTEQVTQFSHLTVGIFSSHSACETHLYIFLLHPRKLFTWLIVSLLSDLIWWMCSSAVVFLVEEHGSRRTVNK